MTRCATPDDLEAVRALLREYAAWIGIDLSFQDFATELETLDSFYEAIFVAEIGGELAGCVALRRIDDETCEMKRLYVRDRFRGHGLGRELVERVISEARSRGYRRMLLDTLPMMSSAVVLYESLGFRDVAAYRFNPVVGARFLELTLE